MSAGLSLIQNLAPTQPTTDPLTSVPSSASERVGAAWEAAQTPDRYWNITAARKDRAAQIIDDYQAVTGERLRNPFDNAPTIEEIRDNPGQPTTAIYAKRLEVLRQKTTDLRSTMPDVAELPGDYLNADSIDSQIGQTSRAARDREDRLINTGNGIPAFISSAGGEMASPHGVLSAFLPVSRMPLAAAERTIAGFVGNVGREALFQAGVNVAAQIPASVIDYNTRAATGTEQTPEQLVDEFVGAAAGGAMLGGAFRGAHLTIRRLQARGVEIPPAVKDAALVVESRTLYDNKNALGVPAAAHEAALDRAVADVSRGRSADVADIIPDYNGAVRESHPELMARYDAAAKVKEEARQAILQTPSEADLAGLKQKFDDAAAAIDAKEQGGGFETRQEELRLRGAARRAAREYEEAFLRREAGDGAAVKNTPEVMAARDRLMQADIEMRDLLSEIRAAYKAAGHDVASLGIREPASEANLEGPKLSLEESARVAELHDNISSYEQFKNEAASAQDKAAWQKGIDDANAEINQILGSDLTQNPAVAKLLDEVKNPSPITQPFTPPEEPTAGRPKTGETPQDKTMQAQVKQLLDEGGVATPEHRRQYEAALQQEKETKVALSCVGGI